MKLVFAAVGLIVLGTLFVYTGVDFIFSMDGGPGIMPLWLHRLWDPVFILVCRPLGFLGLRFLGLGIFVIPVIGAILFLVGVVLLLVYLARRVERAPR